MTVYYLEGKTFGEAVAEYRKKLGWNQQRVASETAVSVAYVSAVENGVKKPSVKFVNSWCLSIGCVEPEWALWHQYAARAHGWRV